MRIEKLREFIAEKELDGIVITHKPNLYYFTGSAPILGGSLLVTADEALSSSPCSSMRKLKKLPTCQWRHSSADRNSSRDSSPSS